jgi:hypothetical protein
MVSSSSETSGLNGTGISFLNSFSQLIISKKGWLLIELEPSLPRPRRLVGSLLSNPDNRSVAVNDSQVGNLICKKTNYKSFVHFIRKNVIITMFICHEN